MRFDFSPLYPLNETNIVDFDTVMMVKILRSIISNEKGRIRKSANDITQWNEYNWLFDYIHSKINFGDYSLNERLHLFEIGATEHPNCKYCEKPLSYSISKRRYPETCSGCMWIDKKDELNRKRETTMVERYGYVKNFSSEQFKDEVKSTCLEIYGVDNAFKSPIIRDRAKYTCLERYGVDHYNKTEEYNDKTKATCLERYGVEHFTQSESFKKNNINANYKGWREQAEYIVDNYSSGMPSYKLCDEIGYSQSHFNKILHNLELDPNLPQNKRWKPTFRSKGEIEIGDFVKSLGFDFENNTRNVIDGELDIYIPSMNLAIEYNGTYWHCDSLRPKEHVIDKLNKCENLGIHLVTIQENVYLENKDKVLNKIRSMLCKENDVIYAKYLELHQISNSVARQFLNNNHIQDSKRIGSIRYGFYNNGVLVGVATFGKFRDGLELIRYCTNVKLVGALQKCISKMSCQNIYSFADRRYTSRKKNIYTLCGFDELSITPQSYCYHRGNRTLSRYQTMKHRLKNIIHNFDANKTEYENMIDSGYVRTWDCGHILYIFRK